MKLLLILALAVNIVYWQLVPLDPSQRPTQAIITGILALAAFIALARDYLGGKRN
jgi:hypothetical protein